MLFYNFPSLKIIICLCVGVGSAIVDISVLYLLNEVVNIPSTLSISIAFISGLIFNYICHTYFTFGKSATKGNFIKYLVVVIINYLLTLTLVNFQLALGFSIILAKIITLPIIAIITFILSNKWVYK